MIYPPLDRISLWKHPFLTFKYFLLEVLFQIQQQRRLVKNHKIISLTVVLLFILLFLLHLIKGPHSSFLDPAPSSILYFLKWLGLGVLSSIGLGTGLHTFVLYLGPFISSVTLAAWECGSLDFPQPPYPHEILCRQQTRQPSASPAAITVLRIASKVKWEAFVWGLGTAFGELPPYLMARTARLSGLRNAEDQPALDDDDDTSSTGLKHSRLLAQARRMVPALVERAGFLGILLCASVPNPLFDLAGITCGHCLVPFWTFFWATVLGKAVFKVSLQSLFVIVCFSPTSEYLLAQFLSKLPMVGGRLSSFFRSAVSTQKTWLHRDNRESARGQTNILLWVFSRFVLIMIIYFIISIVNSLARSYIRRIKSNVH